MQDIVIVSHLSKSYVSRQKQVIKAVDDVSFSVKKGEIVGLLGSNGAGKTTTIKMICSLIVPDDGNVIIDSIDTSKHRNKALGKISAVLEGNRNIYWRLTVRENMEFFTKLKGISPKKIRSKIDNYIQLLGLKDKENETAQNLSRGMQQKLGIAIALASQSEVMILDEPTLGLDVETSHQIRQILKQIAKEDNRTIILSSHDMSLIEHTCNRVIIMSQGKVVTDERVESLMRLFQTKAYRFGIQSSLSCAQKSALNQIPNLALVEENGRTQLIVNFETPDVYYTVTEILGRERTLIEFVDQQEVNFEEVYLKIINGVKEYA